MIPSARRESGTTPVRDGLTSVVALLITALTVGAVIVAGLGHRPSSGEREWILASMLLAVAAAVVYPLLRRRLITPPAVTTSSDNTLRLDRLLRRMSENAADPTLLEDSLTELGEWIQQSLRVDTAEVWVGSVRTFRRIASTKSGGQTLFAVDPARARVLARMPVLEQEWLRVWIPELVPVEEDAVFTAAPIAHAGELRGFIVVARETRRLDEPERRRLGELCRQVAPLLEASRLGLALQSSLDEVRRQSGALEESRARIVRAADDERRRLERDLHDGLQQQLVGITLGMRFARELVPTDPEAAVARIKSLEGDVEEALGELRALAHGIFPPALRDHGLQAVLGDAARRSSLPTQVEVVVTRRHPPAVEATVYFCCLEAIHNACKHANANARIHVRVWEQAGALLFDVSDDGGGFSGPTPTGAGLLNMKDRVGALGGTLRITSRPNEGVSVRALIPTT
jgi:signal transduction histidine kinase